MKSSYTRHGVLALMTLLLSGALFVPGSSLFRWDTLVYNWPILLETRAQWLAGHFPFWASSFCNGTPLLENINAGVLYPLRLVLWLLPIAVGYPLFLTAHVALSLYGMEALLRRGLRLPSAAALLGALSYAGCGYARGMWDTHNFVALPWLPLALVALLEARRSGGLRRAIVGVAAAWSMLLLSGDLQAAALWVPVAGLLALACKERRRLVAALAGGLGLAIPLTAIQWMPTLYASMESYRAGGLDLAEALERSLHPLRLLELFLPYALGNRDAWAGAALMGEGAVRVTPWTSSLGMGLLSVLVWPFALRRVRHNPVARWSALLLIAGLLLAMGRFLPGYAVWQSLPVISSFRYPEKYLLWASLGGTILAGIGYGRLLAWFRMRSGAARRKRFLAFCALALAGLASVAGAVLRPAVSLPWGALLIPLATVLVVALLVVGSRNGGRAWICLAAAAGVLVPWYAEQPLTRRFDPLAKPATIAALPHPSCVTGRVWADPALTLVPLPPDWSRGRFTERQTEFYRETWSFNMPRIWGYETAGGFSPSEAGDMGRFRRSHSETNTSSAAVARYCRLAAVEWLLTTPARLAELRAEGLPITQTAGWGDPAAVLLARITAPAWAVESSARDRVRAIWRPRPGFMRVDLQPGRSGAIRIAESYARGWRAMDQNGHALQTETVEDAFLGVQVAADTNQIRLEYRPRRWPVAVAISAAGLLLFLALLLGPHAMGVRAAARSVWLPAAAAMATAIALGLGSRGEVSCTFDEGFHVARGIAWRSLGDSRLSYFHPPLQNALCGYFADLAFGERIDTAADSAGWKESEVQAYAIELAARNRDRFPDLVAAARWGSGLLLAFLCAVGVWIAHRFGGASAAWLAATGLALQPSLLAHGHLATTDAGVAAFALAGTGALAWSIRRGGAGLGWPILCFLLASVTKHSGLIWLAATLFIVVPVLAWRWRRPALLAWIPLAAAALVLLLLALYGTAPQEIRGGVCGAFPAGRFVEGLMRQSDHALSGHRAYLAGRVFLRGAWWHAPLTLLLKTPEVWSLAAVAAVVIALRRGTAPLWLALLPAGVFAGLLMFAGKLSLGVRHLLPLLALGIVAGAVAVARIRPARLRRLVMGGLVAGTLLALFQAPDRLAYIAAWAGGPDGGPRWVVDSNLDWGQEAGALEQRWATITAEAGAVPTLYYYGFIDPAHIYRLPVGRGSYLGFMGRDRGVTSTPPAGRVTVASISATTLNPHGLPLGAVTNGIHAGSLGSCFRVYVGR